jgi:hypothetical protein
MKGVDRVRGFYLLGGAWTQYVSWRWNWWINLLCSGFAFVVLCFCLHVHNPRTSILRGIQAIDWLGTLAILGLGIMILLGLNIGGVITPWSPSKVICLLVFGFFGGILLCFMRRDLQRIHSCHCTYFVTTRIPLLFLFASVIVL